MRRNTLFLCILLIAAGWTVTATGQQKFEKAEFYSVMKSGDATAVGNEMEVLNDLPANEKEGYEGALLMKKADLQHKAKDKLKFFKEGRIKMETALMADNSNIEFHFLRLAIEEHAPKIVKYHADIEKDRTLIVKNFKNLPPAVQHAILDYCSKSKVLHREDLQTAGE
jgi:hypothetical protein